MQPVCYTPYQPTPERWCGSPMFQRLPNCDCCCRDPNNTLPKCDCCFPRMPFTKRQTQLDWNWLGQVDVVKIGDTGDVMSLECLMSMIAFANITERDVEEFGSRGALHAFMILQIAVEYLLRQNGSLRAILENMRGNKGQNERSPLETQVDMLKKDIRSRDVIIDNLSKEIEDLKHERNQLIAENQTLRNRETRLGNGPPPQRKYYTKSDIPRPKEKEYKKPPAKAPPDGRRSSARLSPKERPMKLKYPSDSSDSSDSEGWT